MNRIRIVSMLIVSSVILSTDLIAQESAARQHKPRYRLVDIGTLGGPSSSVSSLVGNLNKRQASAYQLR